MNAFIKSRYKTRNGWWLHFCPFSHETNINQDTHSNPTNQLTIFGFFLWFNKYQQIKFWLLPNFILRPMPPPPPPSPPTSKWWLVRCNAAPERAPVAYSFPTNYSMNLYMPQREEMRSGKKRIDHTLPKQKLKLYCIRRIISRSEKTKWNKRIK